MACQPVSSSVQVIPCVSNCSNRDCVREKQEQRTSSAFCPDCCAMLCLLEFRCMAHGIVTGEEGGDGGKNEKRFFLNSSSWRTVHGAAQAYTRQCFSVPCLIACLPIFSPFFPIPKRFQVALRSLHPSSTWAPKHGSLLPRTSRAVRGEGLYERQLLCVVYNTCRIGQNVWTAGKFVAIGGLCM